MSNRLAPTVPDRIRRFLGNRGWPRALALRRLVAIALILLAAALALRPAPAGGEPMLVAARDLVPGTTLSGADVRLVSAPSGLRPPAALRSPDEVAGRVLAGAASSGEPLTSARLVGPENTRLTTGDRDAVAVPVRLADPAVADLLNPGTRVDVVASDERAEALLAPDATVVTVLPDGGQRGARLVVVAMPREVATRVAAASSGQGVAVTLR